MNTFHVSLDVPDLERAVAFYAELFGRAPAKRKPGYAKFELADPPVAVALQQSSNAALSHLGIRVQASEDVEAAAVRLRASGLATLVERDSACCYARQDKVWVVDPAGTRWELYAVLADVEESGTAGAPCCTADREDAGACCTA